MSSIRKTILYSVLVSGVLLIIVTLLSLIYDVRFWFIKALDFPRVQVLLGLLVCLILFAIVNKRWRVEPIIFL